jgi:hypothetical protein
MLIFHYLYHILSELSEHKNFTHRTIGVGQGYIYLPSMCEALVGFYSISGGGGEERGRREGREGGRRTVVAV